MIEKVPVAGFYAVLPAKSEATKDVPEKWDIWVGPNRNIVHMHVELRDATNEETQQKVDELCKNAFTYYANHNDYTYVPVETYGPGEN